MRVPRRVVVATLSTALALLGTSFVLAPAAHADCLMIGHADLGAAPALLHNPASQGIRSDGYILWTRNASASGYGKSTHFDWTNARVTRVYVCVWAENTWGTSTFYCTHYTGARQ